MGLCQSTRSATIDDHEALALSGDLLRLCQQKSLSEDGLRDIIERYGCRVPPNNIDNPNNYYRFFHWACYNERVTEGIIRYLLENFPNAARHDDNFHFGRLPLHIICCNKNVTPGMVQLLIDAFPASVRKISNGSMPLHMLCYSNNIDDAAGLKILKLLLERCPESVQHTTISGNLPIHLAAMKQSPEFCSILIEAYPGSERLTNDVSSLPFHLACISSTVATAKYLYDLYPESINVADNDGRYPIHVLCRGNNGVEMLKLLLESCPESAQSTATEYGNLPLHFAARYQSPEFCRILVEAYPGSERITNDSGLLPFHLACGDNTVATAKYLYQLYPESVSVAANNDGNYPIHCAIFGLKNRRDSQVRVIEMVQFLLDCNPDIVLQKRQSKLPLYWVCFWATNERLPKLNAYLKVLRILYDAYPDAIENNEVTSNVGSFCQEVQTFIDIQLSLARQAKDCTLMTTRDENGQLPLHTALCENITLGSTNLITLGSIKLLVKGNPSAVRCADNTGRLPLHVACQHHDSASVVEYLIDLDSSSLRASDFDDNTALHHACCGAKYDTIALLLRKYGGISVSKRNTDRQLPIDLLLQNKNKLIHPSPHVMHRERTHYTDSIFQLIRAYPEIVMRAQSK
jgi:ankyrin repeat protein